MAQVWLVHQLRWDRMVSRPGTCWRPSAVGSIVTLPWWGIIAIWS